jgi:prepilin signal peptidase PulO-like enzyme (type II secretory pathway)
MMWVYVLGGGLAGGLVSATADWLMARRAGQPTGGDWWRQWRLSARGQTLSLIAGCALLSGYLWLQVGPSPRLAIVTGYGWLLLLILVVDLRQRLVYNGVLVTAGVAALAASLLAPPPGLASVLAGGVAGLVVLGSVALASRGGMGAGDVKLAGVIGLMAGFPEVLVALVIGIFAGGLVALVLLATRVVSRKSTIPYAPCLAAGAMVALIHGQNILAWHLSRFGG